MAADKPLQDVLTTVRIPVSDSVIAEDTTNPFNALVESYESDFGMFWNCYPQFFSDRAQNQYSSQFDTYAQKRGPLTLNSFNIPNAVVPTANVTTTWDHICITSLADTFVAAIWDNTAGLIRIIQYKPSAATALQIGTIAGGGSQDVVYLSEGVVANVPTLFVSYQNNAGTATTGLFATSAGGTFVAATLTVIADVDYPSNIAGTHTVGKLIQMDGYAFVMSREGGVFNSDINSISSWNALGVIQANTYPDLGVGLARYKNMIVAFGTDSMEFFTDVGKAPPAGPLGKTDQAFIKFGAAHGKSILSLDDVLYWWAKSSGGKWAMYKLDGSFSPVKVSTIREDIQAARQLYYPELYTLMDRGKQHILSSIRISGALFNTAYAATPTGGFPVGQPSLGFAGDPYGLTTTDIFSGFLAWDVMTGAWWVWSFAGATSNFPIQAQNFQSNTLGGPIYSSITTNFVLMSVGQPRVNAGVAGFANTIRLSSVEAAAGNTTSYIDDATPITAGMQFNTWDWGNEKRKRIDRFKIIQRQYGSSSVSDPLTPWTWVIYNKYEGNYNNSNATLGLNRIYKRACKQDIAIPRTYINNLGSARKWYFGILQKSDMPFSIKAIELDISQSG